MMESLRWQPMGIEEKINVQSRKARCSCNNFDY